MTLLEKQASRGLGKAKFGLSQFLMILAFDKSIFGLSRFSDHSTTTIIINLIVLVHNRCRGRVLR